MTGRGATILSRPRSTSTATHAPSGKPWWWVGSRAYIQDLLPNNSPIWNSLPTESYRDNDLRARPLYANFLGVDALISIHTNGAPDNRAKRGTEVHIQRADSGSQNSLAESQRLGESILCHMKETIHASPNYTQWAVESVPRFINTAETRVGTMSSVIVEVGYHTNLDDAAALQNAIFRTAAMKGVEKGYRMYKEGKPCAQFAITSIPNASGPQNTNISATINYAGNPQFSVKRKTEIISCASGWNCSNYNGSYTSAMPSPLIFNFRCSASAPKPTATFRWRTTLTDVDGVVTNSVEQASTCTAASTTTASSTKNYWQANDQHHTKLEWNRCGATRQSGCCRATAVAVSDATWSRADQISWQSEAGGRTRAPWPLPPLQ